MAGVLRHAKLPDLNIEASVVEGSHSVQLEAAYDHKTVSIKISSFHRIADNQAVSLTLPKSVYG